MKYALKTVSIVLLLAASFAFTACGGGGGGSDDPNTEKMTDAEAVAEDKANLAIGYSGSDSSDSVTQNITLATSGSNGTTITWASDNTDVIATDGTVRPTYGSGDATVTLTATITKNGASETKTFILTVKDPSLIDAALASLTFNKGKLQPVFSAGTTTYLNAPVPFSSEASPAYNDTQSVTVTATTASSGATITINGTSVTSGSAFTMANLDVGKNNATIVVTAQDGVTKTTYTVEVYRAIPIFKTGVAELEGYTFVEGEDGYNDTNNSSLHVSWPSSRFTAAGDESLRDEMTGLVWLKNPDSMRSWVNAITYCEELKTESAAVTDWRMPNVRELRSLVHYGRSELYTWLNGQGFIGIQSSYYWSGTTYASDTAYAWIVDMYDGEVYGYGNKVGPNVVWPVQSTTRQLPVTGQTTVHTTNDDGTYQAGVDAPSSRFTDNGDGTVTDNMTGLMWVKNANAIGTLHTVFDPDGLVDWTNTLLFIAAVNAGTYDCGVSTVYTDWRLPTVNELETLTNYAESEPYTWLNDQSFENVQDSYYMSGTTYAPDTDYAWSVYVNGGYVNTSHKVGGGYVWPVRSAAP